MLPETPSLEIVLQRLQTLEKQNRRLKRSGLLVLVLVGSVLFILSAAKHQAMPTAATEIVEAQRFVLKNARGEIRAILGVELDGDPYLSFWDADDHLRIGLGVWTKEPALNIFDSKGNRRLSLYGSVDGPSIEVTDAAGFKAVVGTTDLQTDRTGEAHRTSAASVVMLGKDGKVIWRAP